MDDLTLEEPDDRQIEENFVLMGPLPKTKTITKAAKQVLQYNY